jgi:hypothetical protein
MQRYLDCGRSGTIENAETYQITLSIMTSVTVNPSGGSVVGIGTPEEIAAIDESHTGFFLKEIFAGKQW